MAAEHSKSLAPNTLFMDGSLARNNFTEQSFATEALASPAVDVFSCESSTRSPSIDQLKLSILYFIICNQLITTGTTLSLTITEGSRMIQLTSPAMARPLLSGNTDSTTKLLSGMISTDC